MFEDLLVSVEEVRFAFPGWQGRSARDDLEELLFPYPHLKENLSLNWTGPFKILAVSPELSQNFA